MTATPQPQQPTPLREIDISHYVKHYWHLLWRWKWWIVIAGPVVSAAALIFQVKVAPNPELTATVLIGLENTTSMITPVDLGDVDNSKAEIIKTRTFLKDIVSQLSLQLVVGKYTRSEIFSAVLVDSLAKPGTYSLEIDKENSDGYTVTFTSRRLGYKDKVVESGKLASLDVLKLPGIFLQFSRGFLRNPHEVTFYILSMPKAIENLHNGISIKRPDFRRNIYHIEVSLKGRDYSLIAEILNAVADAFVEKKLMFKRRRTLNVLNVLEKQYKKARDGLNRAENRLKHFRSANPTVGLTQSTQQTLNTMVEMETNAFTIKNALKEAEDLQTKLYRASGEDKTQVAEEIFVFLNTQGSTAAPVLQAELNRLLGEKRSLQQNYATNHPLAKKNRDNIDKLLKKTQTALGSFIKDTENRVWEKATGIQALSDKLQRLPSKELQLAELQRQHEVNAEIYSTVYDRYNQAKLAETVEVADTYVMDYAVPPIPPPMDMRKILGICMVLGLAMGFGPPIALDMIRKTVRTEFELRQMTNMLVLESIPEIIPAKRKNENSRKKEKKQ